MEAGLIDYAHPMIMVDRKMKEAHEQLLLRNWDAGMEKLLEASVELKMAMNSVRHIKETENALRQ